LRLPAAHTDPDDNRDSGQHRDSDRYRYARDAGAHPHADRHADHGRADGYPDSHRTNLDTDTDANRDRDRTDVHADVHWRYGNQDPDPNCHVRYSRGRWRRR
jgi:hypothetical protein